MNSLKQNSQMVHIISEVVVMIAITFWMAQKNRQLSQRIELLLHRVEEHELRHRELQEKVSKMEKIISQLLGQPRSVPVSARRSEAPQRPVKQPQQVQRAQPVKQPAQQVHVQEPSPQPRPQPVVQPPPDDDLLDLELENELMELQNEVVDYPSTEIDQVDIETTRLNFDPFGEPSGSESAHVRVMFMQGMPSGFQPPQDGPTIEEITSLNTLISS